MERVQRNEQWSLFCPNEAPGLADCWGDEFQNLYHKYEREASRMLDLDIQFFQVDLRCIVTQLCDFRERQRK